GLWPADLRRPLGYGETPPRPPRLRLHPLPALRHGGKGPAGNGPGDLCAGLPLLSPLQEHRNAEAADAGRAGGVPPPYRPRADGGRPAKILIKKLWGPTAPQLFSAC